MMEKKKTGNHIRTKMNFVRSLTRITNIRFSSFFSFFNQNDQRKCSGVFNENAVFYLAQTFTDMKTFQLLPTEYRHHF